MKHTVYAKCTVSADSLGAAEEIAENEEVVWSIQSAWPARIVPTLAGVGAGWASAIAATIVLG